MARLIDIEAINWYDDLFMKGENHSGVWVRYRDVEKLIRNAPTVDAVPVVRCRECQHRDPEDHKCDCGQFERQGCPFPVDDDYFCKYGARREWGDDDDDN